MGHAQIFTFGTGTADTPFSIEAWIIYPIVSASNIVTKGESGNGEWVFGINGNGQLAARVVDLSAGADATRTSVPAVPLNEWVHVAFTYTGLNKMTGAAFFINGVEVSATVNNNPSYVAMENTNYAVTIGTGTTSSGGTIRSFNGTIDEVRILNVARS
ncbi:MAG: LamG domain-containing protein [Candidatus Aenigmarchaeota archaeon]|nr:LamG domain-containing protein [Candidatus Aenigmarchaeota archaeon]